MSDAGDWSWCGDGGRCGDGGDWRYGDGAVMAGDVVMVVTGGMVMVAAGEKGREIGWSGGLMVFFERQGDRQGDRMGISWKSGEGREIGEGRVIGEDQGGRLEIGWRSEEGREIGGGKGDWRWEGRSDQMDTVICITGNMVEPPPEKMETYCN